MREFGLLAERYSGRTWHSGMLLGIAGVVITGLLFPSGAVLARNGASPSALPEGRHGRSIRAQPSLPTLILQVPEPDTELGQAMATVLIAETGHGISSLAFSIDFDPAFWSLDPTDADEDGVPDVVHFHGPGNRLTIARLDLSDPDGELDIALAALGPQAPPIGDGQILSITFERSSSAMQQTPALRFSGDPPPSFGDASGRSIPGRTQILPAPVTVGSPNPTGEAPAGSISDSPDSPGEPTIVADTEQPPRASNPPSGADEPDRQPAEGQADASVARDAAGLPVPGGQGQPAIDADTSPAATNDEGRVTLAPLANEAGRDAATSAERDTASTTSTDSLQSRSNPEHRVLRITLLLLLAGSLYALLRRARAGSHAG